MIKVSLCVDDICHNCPKFIPDYTHITTSNTHITTSNTYNVIEIKCAHSNFCSFIREYVRKENENG